MRWYIAHSVPGLALSLGGAPFKWDVKKFQFSVTIQTLFNGRFCGTNYATPPEDAIVTIGHQTVSVHLNYFSCLEDDLLHLSRWIEFSAENETTYSIELARLLMTTAAEVDVVAKALCRAIDKKRDAHTINVYMEVLLQAVPMLPGATVEIPRFGMTFKPWSNWAQTTSPDWWNGNNKVKHQRAEHFHQANLKNVLNAIAGLLVLLLLLHSKDGPYFPQKPRLFVPRTFAMDEGPSLRLIIPDGANLPWAQPLAQAER